MNVIRRESNLNWSLFELIKLAEHETNTTAHDCNSCGLHLLSQTEPHGHYRLDTKKTHCFLDTLCIKSPCLSRDFDSFLLLGELATNTKRGGEEYPDDLLAGLLGIDDLRRRERAGENDCAIAFGQLNRPDISASSSTVIILGCLGLLRHTWPRERNILLKLQVSIIISRS